MMVNSIGIKWRGIIIFCAIILLLITFFVVFNHPNYKSNYYGPSNNNVIPPMTSLLLSSQADPVYLYLNGVAGNKSILYGTQSNFTANITTTTDFVKLFVNGSAVTGWVEGHATYLKTLSAGLYEVTAATNTTGVANATYYEKINKTAPLLTITDTPGNFTYNGTKDNTSAAITTVNDQLAATLYIGGASKGSSTTRVSYLNATAGTYSGVFNTSGGQNYTSASVQTTSTISRATTVLSLTGYIGAGTSAANFTYNGTVEKFTGSVVSPASGVAGKLYVNGVTKTSPYANATAGTYIAVFNASGDVNYSSASATIAREISQAALAQTLTVFPSDKFTYTGSPPVIQDTLSGTQVSGQSGLSFVLDNNSVSTGSTFSASLSVAKYNFSALSDKYAGVHYKNNYTYSGTSGGNQNYTVTTSGITQVNITKATPVLSMTDTPGNFTYNGTKDNTSALLTTINSQLSASLYINGKNVSATKVRASYLDASAGSYSAVFNTSGNQNYTGDSIKIESTISKAVPKLSFSATPGDFIYNGSAELFTGSISTVNDQLYADLYINGTLEAVNNNVLSYSSSSAGLYDSRLSTSGNQNYIAGSMAINVSISKAKPVLYLNTSGNFTYNGKKAVTYYGIFSINDQLHAIVELNGKVINNMTSAGDSYEENPGTYLFNISTNGNNNYDKASMSKQYAIYPVHKVINSNVISFNGSVSDTVLTESQVLPAVFLINISRIMPGVTMVNLSNISDFIGLSGINLYTNASLSNQSLTISRLNNTACLGNSLPHAVNFFDVQPSFNESKTAAGGVYFFALNKIELGGFSNNTQNISLYKCSSSGGWDELPTYLIAEKDGISYYKAPSSSLSLYGIAKGYAYNAAENISNLTDEFISEVGLPSDYQWTVTYDNVNESQKALVSMLFTNPPGKYPAIFYNISNSSITGTQTCLTTYSPTNVKAGMPIVIPNGLPFTVYYSGSTSCKSLNIRTFNISQTAIIIFSIAFSFIVFLLVLNFLKRKARTTKPGRK